jgi:hypothetical protein
VLAGIGDGEDLCRELGSQTWLAFVIPSNPCRNVADGTE